MALTPTAMYCRDNATVAPVVFTGSQSTTTLTVSAVASGTLAVGMIVWASSTTYLGIISALGSGSGGTGTYTMTNSVTLGGQTLLAFSPTAAGSIGWSSVTAWQASHVYTAGTRVRQKNIGCVFTASTSGSSTTLTISAITSGGVAAGQSLFYAGSSTTPPTFSAYGTSTGGTGTMTMNGAATISSQMMMSLLTPGTERVWICTIAGTSASTEPAWTLTKGSKTTDNTVTWQEVTGQPALNGDTTYTGLWAAGASAVLGYVIVVGSNAHICTTAGTTAGGQPAFASSAGSTTTDNTAIWTCLGATSGFTSWMAPAARLTSMLNTSWGLVGSYIFLGDDHAEMQPTSFNVVSINGTVASPISVVSVNHTTVPPTNSTLLAGASVSTIGNLTLTLISSTVAGLYMYGVTTSAGLGLTSVTNVVNAARAVLDTCTLVKLGSTGNGNAINLGTATAVETTLRSCSFKFGAATDKVTVAGPVRVDNMPTPLAAGSVTPTASLFLPSAGANFALVGADLNGLGTTPVISAVNGGFVATLSGCKLASNGVISSGAISGTQIDALNCDNGATQYQRARTTYGGTMTTETTIVRTGGATIEATGVSDKIVTTANCSFLTPFVSIPCAIRNSVTGSTVTVTVYGITGSGGVPNNDVVWLEVEYPGSGSSPLTSLVTTAKANVLTAGAAGTTISDGSTWGGGSTAFALVATLTSPQLAGTILARVKVGSPSFTVYIDPLIVLS